MGWSVKGTDTDTSTVTVNACVALRLPGSVAVTRTVAAPSLAAASLTKVPVTPAVTTCCSHRPPESHTPGPKAASETRRLLDHRPHSLRKQRKDTRLQTPQAAHQDLDLRADDSVDFIGEEPLNGGKVTLAG